MLVDGKIPSGYRIKPAFIDEGFTFYQRLIIINDISPITRSMGGVLIRNYRGSIRG